MNSEVLQKVSYLMQKNKLVHPNISLPVRCRKIGHVRIKAIVIFSIALKGL